MKPLLFAPPARLPLGFALSVITFSALFSAPAIAAEKPRPSRVLLDFEDPAAARIAPSQATAAIVASGEKNHALQIATQADAAYPSVTLTLPAGMWDLSGYEGLEMDVINPQAAAVRVLLAINNPGADGVHHCNVESATIAAHGRGKVSVPFGNWHGSTGHDLDLTKIASLTVLLDKPGKAHTFMVDNIRAVRFDSAGLAGLRDDPAFLQMTDRLGRGINLGNALEAPTEGAWGVKLKAEYFVKIKAAGFNNVRIPVRWSAHAAQSAPYTIDSRFFARVDWAVRQALANRLVPVLNMHHYEEIFQNPNAHRARFVALWRQIAEHYRNDPPALIFELLNEPHDKLDADHWNPILAEALRAVRKSNPTRDVVIGPTSWNSINDLESLELPASDRHLIVTVHYYSPFQFTHQGADWAGPEMQRYLGTHWTGSPAEKKAVTRDFDKALAWAVAHRRPLYLGEFGSFNKADMPSRARWTRFVAESARERRMGFSYWEFCSSFGAYDPKSDTWIEPLKEALVGSGKTE